MLGRSRLLSFSFPTITLAFLTAVAGCSDGPSKPPAGGQGGGGMGGQGGGGMGGQGGMMGCTVGTTQPCYSGPDGTQDVGLCAAGVQTCEPNGELGACVGEVLPSFDDCASAADEDCSGAALACTGDHVASMPFGAAQLQVGADVAVDAQGNVYTIGIFEGALEFGGAIGTLTSAGGRDVLIVKYDSMGSVLWAKRFGDAANQEGQAIAVDAQGNVYITGSFEGSINFGVGSNTSVGGDDLFAAKLTADGAHVWSRTVGSLGTEQGLDIAVDSTGAAYVTGQYSGDINFVGIIQGIEGYDALLLKFSPTGQPQWGKGLGGTGSQHGLGVAVTSDDQVTFVGAFEDTVDFGGGALTSAGNDDAVIARYDSSGTHLWSRRYGDEWHQWASAVAVDGQGSVLVTGEFAGSMDLGGGMLTCADGPTSADGFVAKFDAMGDHVWSKRFGDMDEQRGLGIAADVFGNIVLAGEFANQVSFGGASVPSAGGRDVFVVKLDPSGGQLWLRRYGSGMMANQSGEAVATDSLTNVWVTGTFEDTIDFGGGVFTSAGGLDMFLAKLAP